jgi:ACS family hexuronate transporter-like MFS transporter
MNPATETTSPTFRITGLRWYICALLFAATVLNYVDRQVFSILAPDLQRDIGWTELDYGRIVIAFQFPYAICYLVTGRFIDRVGTRLGYAVAVVWWSIAEMAHALAHSPFGFGMVRFFLGIGEAANFPTAMKGISEWFPKNERSFATGLFNAAPTLGAIISPILVPLIAVHYGWRGTFVITGALGLTWLVAWGALYRRPEEHSRIERSELELIQAGRQKDVDSVPLRDILRYRQTWAFGCCKLLGDPAWFFYLYWLPKYLDATHGLRGTSIIPYLTAVYVMSGIGSGIGGYISSALLKRGWSLNWARKIPMAVSAFLMPSVIIAGYTKDAWTAVLLVGVAATLHQSWSTMTFTLGTDLFPPRAVATVIGLAGLLGSGSTIVFSEIAGRVLQRDPTFYLPMFIACGVMYTFALAILHFSLPHLEPAPIQTNA